MEELESCLGGNSVSCRGCNAGGHGRITGTRTWALSSISRWRFAVEFRPRDSKLNFQENCGHRETPGPRCDRGLTFGSVREGVVAIRRTAHAVHVGAGNRAVEAE